MSKKKFLLGVVLLLAGQLSADTVVPTLVVTSGGSDTSYTLADVQEIALNNDATMTVIGSGDIGTIPGVTNLSFGSKTITGIKTLYPEASVYVFPNPVQTNLMISGVDKDVKIKLFNLGGTLLQTIPAQENSTTVDVSSLQPGLYLLQIGERTLKFMKQ